MLSIFRQALGLCSNDFGFVDFILYKLYTPAKGGKSPEKTPISQSDTPEPPADDVIAIRTFHLERETENQYIHCGGGPINWAEFVDPLEAAKEEKKPKKKKDDSSKAHQDPLIVLVKTTVPSLSWSRKGCSATTKK